MATNGVEAIQKSVPAAVSNEVSAIQKPAQKEENLSELLSGANTDTRQKSAESKAEKKQGFRVWDALFILNTALFIFSFTKIGQKFTKKAISTIYSKRQQSVYTKRMKNVYRNRSAFQEINFQCGNSAKDIIKKARQLGIKIPAKSIQSAEDIDRYNTILSVLADAHNKSKGRIMMPKKVELRNLEDASGDANKALQIRLDRQASGKDLEYNTCHELGHINHFGRTNVDKLGTPKHAQEFGLDTSKAEEFSKNISLRGDIQESISLYASTEPCEFVAETFAFLMGGIPIPKHLLQRYAQYKGMTRLPVIRDFSIIKQEHNINHSVFSLLKNSLIQLLS